MPAPVSIPLVRHIVNGDAFFPGCGLMLLALLWDARDWKGRRLAVRLFCLVGWILILISSTPAPILWYVFAMTITGRWLWTRRTHTKLQPLRDEESAPSDHGSMLNWAFALCWFMGLAGELPYLWPPTLDPIPDHRVIIIGDSITAGIDEENATRWPELLTVDHGAERHEVVDLSFMGATLSSATTRLDGRDLGRGIVILEIGGNDILGGTTPEEFDRHLNELIAMVKSPDRTLLMFELPLPPFYHRYGYSQRQLAQKHGIKLIPKRILANVLLSRETTLDSIHLNAIGHRQLAAEINHILQPAVE